MKKEVFFIIILIFLITLINQTNAANCGGDLVCDCGDTLTQTRTFNETDSSNLANCETVIALHMEASNLILNCNNLDSIEYTGGDDTFYAINITNFNNITITNCIISGWAKGIYMLNSNNNNISNINIDSSTTGIYLDSAFNNILNNITINRVTDKGIYLESS
ncbi:right-handed parallel beta-helix repeat-containing protein, partial [archaeon]|nr:right-handed parallel beta-helix repeat-containing protein [archaeon]